MATALITGASTGFGELFARRFAKDGYDVVLVARNEARLQNVADHLRISKVKAHVIALDLSDPSSAMILADELAARGLQIDVLVNNAGFGSNGAFLELDLAHQAEMIELNCNTLMKLCHLFGQQMKTRGTGKILNIASTAAFQPGPYMATYYATKAFVLSFSEALHYELRGTGVTVTCSCPGATKTEFAKRANNEQSPLIKRIGEADPVAVVEQAYEACMEGEAIVVHGVLNWLSTQAVRGIPRATASAIAGWLNHSAPTNAKH